MRTLRIVGLSFLCLLLLALVAGCGGVLSVSLEEAGATPTKTRPAASIQPTAAATAVASAASSPTPDGTSVPAPLPTVTTQVPRTVTATAIGAGSGAAASLGGSVPYLDDRSTAASLIQSYFNAINLKQYLRAYSYWQPGAAQLKPYAQFEQGYAATANVRVTLGQIGESAGAGNFYNTVPVTLLVQTTDGGRQTFVGCYMTHLGSPDAQGTVPFRPLAIESAAVQQVQNDANTAALLATACQAPGIPSTSPVPVSPTPNPSDISSRRYLDDRSDPVEVIRSYFNAVNLRQYVRAYSYWEPGAAASQLKPFAQFAQGYQTTQSVQLATGSVMSDAGAGQIYYKLPVSLTAKTTGGATETYVGCYTLHISRPEIQGVPPFQPLGITAAKINQVDVNADAARLMEAACR